MRKEYIAEEGLLSQCNLHDKYFDNDVAGNTSRCQYDSDNPMEYAFGLSVQCQIELKGQSCKDESYKNFQIDIDK